MSILYFVIFKMFGEFLISGSFRIGRLVDLAQMDLLAFILWRILVYERWRYHYLLDRDKR